MAAQDERDEQDEHAGQAPRAATAAKAAKLVFTDPLSRQTSDDTDRGWGESEGTRGLDWYQSQRPPHHGD
ncbi:hypothetical protein OG500_22485 [Kitasatospora sp. NBC_01250]|uniref:hypothetical protein n=1 Tax=Kitasatospora sp. NBC_01250 TaxID=2903571 RepID=UPI002E31DC96|nr:hypothetical protein [Kitasatospora sp. NBC_01250]